LSSTVFANLSKVKHVNNLKTIATSNCRLLYGTDRNRFYDTVISYDEDQSIYGAYLVCTVDGATKALRHELADDPTKAAQMIVNGLVKDTALLFTKYAVGDRMRGQQGERGDKGYFELY
ncbi:hypothetical protein K504DRAFT_354386, partial [Pleomassaria siparia CBS 279.74]